MPQISSGFSGVSARAGIPANIYQPLTLAFTRPLHGDRELDIYEAVSIQPSASTPGQSWLSLQPLNGSRRGAALRIQVDAPQADVQRALEAARDLGRLAYVEMDEILLEQLKNMTDDQKRPLKPGQTIAEMAAAARAKGERVILRREKIKTHPWYVDWTSNRLVEPLGQGERPIDVVYFDRSNLDGLSGLRHALRSGVPDHVLIAQRYGRSDDKLPDVDLFVIAAAQEAYKIGDRLREGNLTTVIFGFDEKNNPIRVLEDIFVGNAKFDHQDKAVTKRNEELGLKGQKALTRLNDLECAQLAEVWDKVAPPALQGSAAPWFWGESFSTSLWGGCVFRAEEDGVSIAIDESGAYGSSYKVPAALRGPI